MGYLQLWLDAPSCYAPRDSNSPVLYRILETVPTRDFDEIVLEPQERGVRNHDRPLLLTAQLGLPKMSLQ